MVKPTSEKRETRKEKKKREAVKDEKNKKRQTKIKQIKKEKTTEEKPSCPECKKTFARAANVARHLTAIHKLPQATAHIKSITPIQLLPQIQSSGPHTCKTCGEQFDEGINLFLHVYSTCRDRAQIAPGNGGMGNEHEEIMDNGGNGVFDLNAVLESFARKNPSDNAQALPGVKTEAVGEAAIDGAERRDAESNLAVANGAVVTPPITKSMRMKLYSILQHLSLIGSRLDYAHQLRSLISHLMSSITSLNLSRYAAGNHASKRDFSYVIIRFSEYNKSPSPAVTDGVTLQDCKMKDEVIALLHAICERIILKNEAHFLIGFLNNATSSVALTQYENEPPAIPAVGGGLAVNFNARIKEEAAEEDDIIYV